MHHDLTKLVWSLKRLDSFLAATSVIRRFLSGEAWHYWLATGLVLHVVSSGPAMVSSKPTGLDWTGRWKEGYLISQQPTSILHLPSDLMCTYMHEVVAWGTRTVPSATRLVSHAWPAVVAATGFVTEPHGGNDF